MLASQILDGVWSLGQLSVTSLALHQGVLSVLDQQFVLAQPDPSGWGQFGLSGLVIASLFASLAFVVKWMVSHIDKKDERHFEERMAWRETIDRLTDEMTNRDQQR